MIAKVIEVSAGSPESFDHAVKRGIERASKSVKNITGAWVKEQQVIFQNDKIAEFRVLMKVTFLLEG